LKSEDLFPDLYTTREISQKRTSCIYQQFGCQVKLSPVDMETHITQCTYKQDFSESRGIFYIIKNTNWSYFFLVYCYNYIDSTK